METMQPNTTSASAYADDGMTCERADGYERSRLVPAAGVGKTAQRASVRN